MAIDPSILQSYFTSEDEPDYSMRDRDMVAKAIMARGGIGMPTKSGIEQRMLPDRFYSPDNIQIDNGYPMLENRPTWYPEDHPDFGTPAEQKNAPDDFRRIAMDDGEAFQMLMSVKDDAEPDGVIGAPAPGEPPFQAGGNSIAAGAYNWLIDNGKISSEDAARAAAGLDIPAEIVARIGLGQAFLDQYPELRKSIENGEATGLIDALAGQFINASGSAAIRRRIASGQDAMRRMLTGAALTGSETDEYIDRYGPSITDDTTSLLDKTDQLEREIKYIMGALMIGRGGTALLSDLKDRAAAMGGGGAVDNPLPKDKKGDGEWRDMGGGIRLKVR